VTLAVARRGERGFSLVAAMAAIAIMMFMMGAAVPSWRYVMKNAREEELLFRGMQIADAIERYQKKHGGAPPTSMDQLVKGKFLRKDWKDPMTRDGEWRLLRQGEVGPMGMRPRPRRERGGPGGEPGMGRDRGLGAFVGVASTSEDDSFRTFNGQTQYDKWHFAAGQPRIVGRQKTFGGVGLPNMPGGAGQGPAGQGQQAPGPAKPGPQQPQPDR
jgi:type II secretory pathway pseudopilin PulG